MRVAVINITAGGMSGGYRKYLMNIIPRIAACPSIKSIMSAAPLSLKLQHWFGSLDKIQFVNTKASGFSYFNNHSELERYLEKFVPDVIFVPVERYFRFNKVPVVSMVQNMEPFVKTVKGNPLIERVKLKLKYIEGKKAVCRSNRIIAISEFVMNFLSTHWRIPEEKIGLIYHGLDAGPQEEGDRPLIIPESWTGRFLFTAGSIRPARGLEDLLLAMEHIGSLELKGVKLVIAGDGGPTAKAYKKKMLRRVRQMNLSSNICWAGQLNDREMTWCYQNCRAFIMTSRVESFGIIGGEAMAYGCICIAADNPCLPELFGDAALYYPPQNGKALAGAIKTVLSWDDHQRKTASAKAIKRAAGFSWDVCAQKTVAELVKAAA